MPAAPNLRYAVVRMFNELVVLVRSCYSRVANPFSPYSIQKRSEPQICPKFVPTIVFRGSNQGNPNLSKICRKFDKRQISGQIFKFSTNF